MWIIYPRFRRDYAGSGGDRFRRWPALLQHTFVSVPRLVGAGRGTVSYWRSAARYLLPESLRFRRGPKSTAVFGLCFWGSPVDIKLTRPSGEGAM